MKNLFSVFSKDKQKTQTPKNRNTIDLFSQKELDKLAFQQAQKQKISAPYPAQRTQSTIEATPNKTNVPEESPRIKVMNYNKGIRSLERAMTRDELIEHSATQLLGTKKEKKLESIMSKHQKDRKKFQKTRFDLSNINLKEEEEQLPTPEQLMISEVIKSLEQAKENARKVEEQSSQIKQILTSKEGDKISIGSEQQRMLLEELIQQKERADKFEFRYEDLRIRNQKLEFEVMEKNCELSMLQQELEGCKQSLALAKSAGDKNQEMVERVEKLARENRELKEMQNSEIEKMEEDNRKLAQKVEEMKKQIAGLTDQVEQGAVRNGILLEELNDQKVRAQELKIREQTLLQKQRLESLSPLAIIVTNSQILNIFEGFIDIKDVFQLSSVNKKMYSCIRENVGVLKLVQQVKAAMEKKEVKSGDLQHYKGKLVQKKKRSRDVKLQDIFRQVSKNDIDHSQFPYVTLADIQKVRKNKILVEACHKFVKGEYQAGSNSVEAIEKAEDLLLNYVDLVYTEEELLEMRQNRKVLDELLAETKLLSSPSRAPFVAQSLTSIQNLFKNSLAMPVMSYSGSVHSLSISGSLVNYKDFQSMLQETIPVAGEGNPMEMTFDVKRNLNSSFQVEENLCSISQDGCVHPTFLSVQEQICEGFFSRFDSSQEVYKYLVNVGTALVVEREKITQFFRDIQQSFAELFYCSKVQLEELRELELVKDYLKIRLQFLKQRLREEEEERERVLKLLGEIGDEKGIDFAEELRRRQ